MEKIQAGDIVQLLSGGPKMTVGRSMAFNEALCYWIDENGNIKEHKLTKKHCEK